MAADRRELSESPPTTSSHPPDPLLTSGDTSVAPYVVGIAEQLTHRPSSQPRRCGRRVWSEEPGSGVAWVLYRPCGERRCRTCGADNRQRRADQLTDQIGQTSLWRLELAASVWRNARDRMRRARRRWVPIPVDAGALVVFVDGPWPGAAVVERGHNAGELSAACARLPVGARVFPSKGWQPSTPADGDQPQRPPRRYGMLLVDDDTMELTADRVGATVRRYPFGYRVDMTGTSRAAQRELHRNTTYRPEPASYLPHGHPARRVDG